MGTLSGGNGGWPPEELPDLPPEWGTIVIPDDASELAGESTRVRRELRREARRSTWRRRLHLASPPPRSPGEDTSTLGVPLLVISIAVIATLTSLFAIAWPTSGQRPTLQPSAVATTPVSTPPAPVPGDPSTAGGGRDTTGGPDTTGAPHTIKPGAPRSGATQPRSAGTPHALGASGSATLHRPDFAA
jgi:hypothetical protein